MLNFAPWKTALILLVSLGGLWLASPNLFNAGSIPSVLPSQQISLGLDLRGGAHLLVEVDIDAIVQERLETLESDVRTSLRSSDNGTRIGYRGLGVRDDHVSVRIRDLGQMDEALRRLRELSQPVNAGLLGGGGGQSLEINRVGNDAIELRLTDQAIDAAKRSAVSQSLEIVRVRIDEMGTREASIQRQGEDRILIQVPGLDDPQALKRILGTTAKMTFHLVDHSVTQSDLLAGRTPPGTDILEYRQAPGDDSPPQYDAIKRKVEVSGEDLVDAQPGYDGQTNEPVVNFRFNFSGAKKFAKVTTENVGKRFAIVLDDKVITAPNIREPITGGSGQISGGFTVESANELAILLRAGALPAPLTIIEERTVGPELGADSIEAGRIASMIAFGGVIVFMLITYGLFGGFANIALIVNLGLIMGVLSALQATLTLPGIAGIVLTIGMAVDANVLIFERIREELRAGKTALNAVDTGYQRALSTILDANITTFIAAAILYSMGSGPVKGFAVTLAVGIVTSVFTAFVLTRLFVATWIKARRPKTLSI